jgi:hypothetical protein
MPGAKKVKAKYIYDPAYRMVAANGIYGGLTPRGDLRIDFFVEYQEPREVAYRVDEAGQASEEPTAREPDFLRRIQVGVLVSRDHVRSFAAWFGQKADEIDKLAEIEKLEKTQQKAVQ